MDQWVDETYEANALASLDRALLLMGVHRGFRRSELVALDVADVEFVDQGFVARFGATKTDQAGKRTTKGLPKATPRRCSVEAIEV